MKKGLLVVNTGNGKGKTTAALGVMLRAWGRGMRVCMLQFLKSSDADYGEYKAAEKLGMEIIPLGDGCIWTSKDLDTSKEVNIIAWQTARDAIQSGKYDIVILDEFSHLLHLGWLDVNEVVEWIEENKPTNLHLIITGRYAPQELIDAADLVTEMVEIKHPYAETGLTSQPGVDK